MNENYKEILNMRYKNLGIHPANIQKIPPILHHIWLTSDKNPRDINNEQIQKTLRMAEILSLDPYNNWQINIWTNKPEAMITSKPIFEQSNITFSLISTLKLNYVEQNNLDFLISHQYWGMASDNLRYIIIKQLGGFYADIGADFYRAPGLDLYRYDFLANQWSGSLCANNFFAAKKFHPALIHTSLIVEENIQKLINNGTEFEGETIKDLTTSITADPFNEGIYMYFSENLSNHTTIDVIIPHSKFHNNKNLIFDGVHPNLEKCSTGEDIGIEDICAADFLFIGQDALAGETWY